MSKCVGKNVPRLDGPDKVTGAPVFVDDMKIEGVIFGSVVRSQVPNARIKSISRDENFDWNGTTIVTAKDIVGKNATIFMTEDQPILASDFVRHVGEAVALVAAETREKAEEAARHVKVEVEELPAVLTIEESKAGDKIIWGQNNVLAQYLIEKGDTRLGFETSDVIVEGEYRTPSHEHAYIEPQGVVALPRDDGGLTVMGSLQCPFYVLKTLKAVFNCDESKVNVRQTTMGGAFGGKEDYPSLLGAYAALLCKKSGRPVKMVYKRDEDILVTTKRHPSIVKHKTGVKKDGTLVAMEIEVLFDGGAYSTLSPVVLSRGVIHAAGPYRCPNVRAHAACYATNHVPCGAFRGFGAPQTLFALEAHIDRIAEALGIDPLTMRRKNVVKIGDTLSTTQLIKDSCAAEKVLEKAAASSQFEKKWQRYHNAKGGGSKHPRIKKGIGLSLFMHGGAFTGAGESLMKTEAGLRLEEDGTISVLTGCTDMGQGAHTVLPQIAADALGVPIDDVACVTPDTAVVPDSGPTVASRTTMIIGNVLEKCAFSLRNVIFEFVASAMNEDISKLLVKDGDLFSGAKKLGSFKEICKRFYAANGAFKAVERYELPPGIKWDAAKHLGDAYPAYSWAADVAEVSVDADTFEVKVDKFTVAVDPGKAVNPVLLEGQMEGGSLQALGWALMEDPVLKNGRPAAERFQTYIIPTVADTPEWKVHFIEDPFAFGPQGAKGIGELPLDGGAPAVVNAIHNATGIKISSLPATPERLFEAWVSHGVKK